MQKHTSKAPRSLLAAGQSRKRRQRLKTRRGALVASDQQARPSEVAEEQSRRSKLVTLCAMLSIRLGQGSFG
jgi:hypothetical protein